MPSDPDTLQLLTDLRALVQYGVFVLEVCAYCLFGLFVHRLVVGR